MEPLKYIWQMIRMVTVMDILDIIIVSYLLYKVLKVIKGTSAERLLKGIVVLLIILQISDWLSLNVINFILRNIMQLGLIALIILFQPELRKMLEKMGKSKFYSFWSNLVDKGELQTNIVQVVEACSSMSWTKTGALIVFEKTDSLSEIVKTGTELDADISSELIKNIFYPKAPLHDGALIISNGRLVAAGCVLPLSANPNLSRDLGTRHRAAVGMSEQTDALCIVVSEETGSISVASGGMLKRHLAAETLEKLLENEFESQESLDKKNNHRFASLFKGGKSS